MQYCEAVCSVQLGSVQCAAWQCGPAPLATRSPAASKNVAATLLGEKALESENQDPSLTAPPHTGTHRQHSRYCLPGGRAATRMPGRTVSALQQDLS